MRIRLANAPDIERLMQLADVSPSAAHWSRVQYEAVLAAEASDGITLVADDSTVNRIVGFLVATRVVGDWEIENVVVAELWRRQHIAHQLVNAFLEMLPANAPCSVLLEVRESNMPAHRLYEKIGFTREGRRKDYYQNPTEDAILYRLPLRFCDKIP
jgi:[ribosomal protein S18]-alanine N-acetyltransferase